jgi:hypothetical protein
VRGDSPPKRKVTGETTTNSKDLEVNDESKNVQADERGKVINNKETQKDRKKDKHLNFEYNNMAIHN